MNGKLTLTQIRVIFILVAVALVAVTYFFIFQANLDKASKFDASTQELKKEENRLRALQTDVTNLETVTSLYADEVDDYIQSFPVKLTQQKSLSLIYRLMINSGVEIENISPGNPVPFYFKGDVLTSSSSQAQADTESEEGEEELSEITVVDMSEMIGSTAKYTISVKGTTKEIYKAIDWITEKSSEKLSLGNVSLQYDSSTGELTGSIEINFYCMLGNGVPYKEPDTSEFSYGLDNVFGAADKIEVEN